jgi:phosphoserine phosphatase
LELPKYLITVSGPDSAGITANLMDILVQTKTSILDMGQAVTHGLLSLSFLIELDRDDEQHPVLKELLFITKSKNLELRFQKLEDKNEHRIRGDKFVLHCIGQDNLNAEFLRDLSTLLADLGINIHRIDNMGTEDFKALEMITTIPDEIDLQQVKEKLLGTSSEHRVDIAFLKDNVFRRSKRLIVFDMDSTLIQTEVIDEMAATMGVEEKVKEITEKAMNGEYDFDQALKERVALLKGMETKKMKQILDNLPLTPGVETFINTVKGLGYKTALISGGFSYFAEALQEKLGIDYAFSNELQIKEGKLTGKVEGAIINSSQKALLLKMIAQQEKISLEQVVAIGDGANDLPMLSTAGLGIAFHAKDIVRKKADHHMSHGPMTTILYFLGIPLEDQSSH